MKRTIAGALLCLVVTGSSVATAGAADAAPGPKPSRVQETSSTTESAYTSATKGAKPSKGQSTIALHGAW